MVEAEGTGFPHQRNWRYDMEEPIDVDENIPKLPLSIQIVRIKTVAKLEL